jgi:hypothetical protein
MLACITGGYKTTAKIAGNKLVLSFPDAEKPSIWTLDLAEAQGCIFELEESKSLGGYDLVRVGDKGAKKIIASYDSRGKALAALVKTTKALEGVTVQNQNAVIIQNRMGGFPILKILFILLLVVGGLMLYKNMAQMNVAPQLSQQSNRAVEQQTPPAPVEQKAGVPLSAEDFLNQR